MRSRLPSLTALRAFDAVARELSFTAAADTLGVTQAAVSRQVRLLEDALSVRLVERRGRQNALTDAGQDLFAALGAAFAGIEEAVERITGSAGRHILNVSVAPFFSSVWLTPRLMGFIAQHPDVDLRLHHSYRPADYLREGIDIGINWGTNGVAGTWTRAAHEKVLSGALTVVVAPRLAATWGARPTPADLLRTTLLYEFSPGDWHLWLQQAGIAAPEGQKMLRLNDSHALRRAAIDGHGAALFFAELVGDDLRDGRLVRPFELNVDTGYDYRLNYSSDRELPAKARRFRRWVLDQAAQDRARAG